MNISEFIPRGHNNAVSRRDLCLITGLHDRDLRRQIAISEEPIYNIGKGDGYFRYGDSSDVPYIKEYAHSERRRIQAIKSKLKKIDAQLDGLEDLFNG